MNEAIYQVLIVLAVLLIGFLLGWRRYETTYFESRRVLVALSYEPLTPEVVAYTQKIAVARCRKLLGYLVKDRMVEMIRQDGILLYRLTKAGTSMVTGLVLSEAVLLRDGPKRARRPI